MAKPKRYQPDDAVLAHLLSRAGWDLTKGTRAAIRAYQKFHGLKADGWAGPVTERHMQRPRFCSHPDRMETKAKGRWSPELAADLKWGVTGSPDGMSLATFKDHVQQAFDSWSSVCGIKASYTKSAKAATHILSFGKIDGPGGTLAWSELPTGMGYKGPALKQLYDDAERWEVSIDIDAVLRHELGHALGLPHLSDGSLMQPFYDPKIVDPQTEDVAEMVALYGPPQDPPATPPQPPAGKTLTIRFTGAEIVG